MLAMLAVIPTMDFSTLSTFSIRTVTGFMSGISIDATVSPSFL